MSGKVERYMLLNQQRVEKHRLLKQIKMERDKESENEVDYTSETQEQDRCEGNPSVQDFLSTFEIPEEARDNKQTYIIIEPAHCENKNNIEEEEEEEEEEDEGEKCETTDPIAEEPSQQLLGSNTQLSKIDFLLSRLKKVHANYEHSILELQAMKECINREMTLKTRDLPCKRTADGMIKQIDKEMSEDAEAENTSKIDGLFGSLPVTNSNNDVELSDNYVNVSQRIRVMKSKTTQTQTIGNQNSLTVQNLDQILKKYFDNFQNTMIRHINNKLGNVEARNNIEPLKSTPFKKQKSMSSSTPSNKHFFNVPQVKLYDEYITFNDFSENYPQYSFPIKTDDEFNNFLEDLQNNENDIKNHLKQYLYAAINFRDNLQDVATTLIKKLLSKHVIQNYTTQRAKPGKLLFKSTQLYTVLLDAFLQVYNTHLPNDKHISEKHVLNAIGVVFNNAKDWEGGRTARFNHSYVKIHQS